MAKFIPERFKPIAKELLFPIPSELKKNFRSLNKAQYQSLKDSLLINFYKDWRSRENYSKEQYNADFLMQIKGRLELDRREIIPWLNNARSLSGQKILEIGCGSGSSSIALAEQNANLIGIDIDTNALKVARKRAKLYGLDIIFKNINCIDYLKSLKKKKFDHIIFFASLEHMTIIERITSIKSAWSLLNEKGLLTIIEAPNRLWFYDDHTSLMNFFHWLPDELAFSYSKFSKRGNFNNLYNNYSNHDQRLHFLRRGRGISFHEFDLAIGNTEELSIISSLSKYQGIRHKFRVPKKDRIYKKFISDLNPKINQGFMDKYLYLIIEKNNIK